MLPLDTVSVLNSLKHAQVRETRGVGRLLGRLGRPTLPPALVASRALESTTRLTPPPPQQALSAGMRALRSVGVDGVTVDIWWGVVEAAGPRQYDWAAYRELIQLVASCGLKLQVVLSFHACGCNVGDCCTISLPPWVLATAQSNPDVFFTDASGRRADEYLSFAVDELPLFHGRSPVEMYTDFMAAFRSEFESYLGPDNVIPVVCASMGPAGELRYPAYPEGKWRFPGIGEFQCYDKYSLASLRAAAHQVGQPAGGTAGPHDAGSYNSKPPDTTFFTNNGRWASPYGHFFLSWYAGALVAHGDRVLGAAAAVFAGSGATIAGKLPGIHWWYKTRSRAAEATAGIYCSGDRDGYGDLIRVFATHGALLDFTCAEMRDGDLPGDAACGPEDLIARVRSRAAQFAVPLAAENALPRFDARAHEQILRNAYEPGGSQLPPLASFTYLRMSERLFHPSNWGRFVHFVRSMAFTGGGSGQEESAVPALVAAAPVGGR